MGRCILCFKPSPAVEVKIATQKVPIFTLTTVYPIFSPTVHSLLFFKYYFLIILFYFFSFPSHSPISLSLSGLPQPPTDLPNPNRAERLLFDFWRTSSWTSTASSPSSPASSSSPSSSSLPSTSTWRIGACASSSSHPGSC